MAQQGDNVVQLGADEVRFGVEFTCTGCGARVFAAVKVGRRTQCLACEWWGPQVSIALADVVARLRAAGLAP